MILYQGTWGRHGGTKGVRRCWSRQLHAVLIPVDDEKPTCNVSQPQLKLS